MSSRATAARERALQRRRDESDFVSASANITGGLETLEASSAAILSALESDAEKGRDAFGRLRVSSPVTIFDSKQIFDNAPLYWDDQEVSGASTTSTHSVNRASSVMGVAAATAGLRVRQTFQRFNYQPGKSLQVLCTGIMDASGGGTGITRRIGYFDDKNGLFFEDAAGVINVVQRSFVTGSAVDTAVPQSSWNKDKLDGTGPSGITADFTKAQIYSFDLEWLGVGTTRFGFVLGGETIYCHSFDNSNSLDSVYMSTPNLPMRYEIENDGTGAASTLEHICATVIIEAGQQALGVLRYRSTEGTHINANAANTLYACVGIRLKSTHLAETIDLSNITMISTLNDDFEWTVLLNPTVAGTFTYSDEANSAVQTAIGGTANTVTGGTAFEGKMVKVTGEANASVANAIRLGSAIDGTPDEIVLCVRPLTANADIEAGMSWRELS